jgi:hypothetical protein
MVEISNLHPTPTDRASNRKGLVASSSMSLTALALPMVADGSELISALDSLNPGPRQLACVRVTEPGKPRYVLATLLSNPGMMFGPGELAPIGRLRVFCVVVWSTTPVTTNEDLCDLFFWLPLVLQILEEQRFGMLSLLRFASLQRLGFTRRGRHSRRRFWISGQTQLVSMQPQRQLMTPSCSMIELPRTAGR